MWAEITNHMVMSWTKAEEKQMDERPRSPKKQTSIDKRNRKVTAITSGEITPQNRHCLEGLEGKYGRWVEILCNILNSKLQIVQNWKKSESDAEVDDDDDEEEMPEETGNRTYDTSERDGHNEPIRTRPEEDVIQIHTNGEIPQCGKIGNKLWRSCRNKNEPNRFGSAPYTGNFGGEQIRNVCNKPADFTPEDLASPGTSPFNQEEIRRERERERERNVMRLIPTEPYRVSV